MNPADDSPHPFDRQARQWHAVSLAELSPQTLARLRAARHAAQTNAPSPRGSHRRWLAATAFTALLAVGVGVRFLPQGDAPAASEAPIAPAAGNGANSEYGTAGVLDENPDLYLWLASAEAPPLAME